MMPRTEIGRSLNTAHDIINGGRQDQYGAPEDSFALIAEYWNVHLRQRLQALALKEGLEPDDLHLVDLLRAEDIAIMMTLFKLAREAHQHKADNVIDALGYLAIYNDRLAHKPGEADQSAPAARELEQGA